MFHTSPSNQSFYPVCDRASDVAMSDGCNLERLETSVIGGSSQHVSRRLMASDGAAVVLTSAADSDRLTQPLGRPQLANMSRARDSGLAELQD